MYRDGYSNARTERNSGEISKWAGDCTDEETMQYDFTIISDRNYLRMNERLRLVVREDQRS